MTVMKKILLVAGLAKVLLPWGISQANDKVGFASDSAAQRSSVTRWVNTVRPPTLSNPMLITISRSTSLSSMGDYDSVGCSGKAYRFRVPFDRDALVTMSPDLAAIEYPVWIEGGRNVHLRGLEMRTKVQSGCGVGQAHQVRNSSPNIHPRLPGNKAFLLNQAGTTFLEGIDIDLRGQEADCFVSRNPDSLSASQIKSQRNIHIVNTRCVGIEGLSQSPIGDGIHGDFYQNQGRDDIGSLVLENVTYRSSSNGITLHRWHKTNPRLFSLMNVDYGWDLRYTSDSRYEHQGLAFTANADKSEFRNVWINDGRGLDYGIFNGQRVGAISSGSYILKVPGFSQGPAPQGEFAPAEHTGREYQTMQQTAAPTRPAPNPQPAPAPQPAPPASPEPGTQAPDSRGYAYSRTDKSEYRWIDRNSQGQWGSTWISRDCAVRLGGAVRSGDWTDLLRRAPGFDTIANPCLVAVTPTQAPESRPSADGFAFSRTDKNEYRWIQENASGVLGSIWIDKACAERLGGVRQRGDWTALIELAPGFDTIRSPC